MQPSAAAAQLVECLDRCRVGEIRRRDFGLDTGLLAGALLGDVLKLELDVQFIEPSTSTEPTAD